MFYCVTLKWDIFVFILTFCTKYSNTYIYKRPTELKGHLSIRHYTPTCQKDSYIICISTEQANWKNNVGHIHVAYLKTIVLDKKCFICMYNVFSLRRYYLSLEMGVVLHFPLPQGCFVPILDKFGSERTFFKISSLSFLI